MENGTGMRLRIYEICGSRIRSSATDPRRMHSVGDSEISMNGQIRENAAPSDRGAPSGNTRVMRSFWMIGKVPSGLWSVLLFVTGGASSLALIIFATRHIGSIGFWFDESVQFWMSLGEDPFAQPFSRRGPLPTPFTSMALTTWTRGDSRYCCDGGCTPAPTRSGNEPCRCYSSAQVLPRSH
jgi:hypothetical protein